MTSDSSSNSDSENPSDSDADETTELEATPSPEEWCGAKKRNGEPCPSWPVQGSSRCRMHGGVSTGPPKGSANNFAHGATAEPLNLVENDLLDEADVEWIYALRDAYLEEAPFGPDSPKVERLTRTCVMIFQEWAGERHVLEEGLAVEDVVGVTDKGEPIISTREHYLSQRIDRLNDKVRHNLRELGLLDDPETQRADAEGDKAAALRELMARADEQ
jgi:hypothetical protein